MKPKRTGPSAIRTTEGLTARRPLRERYSRHDMTVLSREDRRGLHIDERADPRRDPSLAWELLYRLEPALYDRLVKAERLHPSILKWLPAHVDRIVEVGAGTGRLTLELVSRCNQLTAVEPAAPLREILNRKIDAVCAGPGAEGERRPRIRVISGFFQALPLADRSAELVIACSVLTPEAGHGGERGLAEMERVCAIPGLVVIVWPNHVEWLSSQGYRYVSFPGEMTMAFASVDEAVELAQIFYPAAVEEIRRRADRRVPYEVLGVNPPRDLAYKMMV